jgi:hypothetical protein
MGDNTPPAPANDPAPTGGEPSPTAPEPSKDPQAAPDETVTIPKSEYEGLQKSNKDLLSQRDRNAEESKSKDDFLNQLAAERFIDDFLGKEENKKKFPDVKRDDLVGVSSPDDVEELAGNIQRRLDDHAQAKLESVQNTTAPVLSPQERAEKEKALKQSNDPKAFEKMVDLRTPASAPSKS